MTTSTTAVAATGAADRTARLSRWAIPLICVAQLMATLDVTIVNLALPAIDDEFGMSGASLAWVVDAYVLAYAGLLLIGGRLGDLVGRRRTLRIGIGVFMAASLAAGLAQSEAVLLAARAGQGVGAALATPTTLALITALFAPGPARNRVMVAYGAMAGLGITLGLVLGGVLTQYASWRWVFLLNVPIGVLLIAAAPRVLPESRGRRRRLDLVGAALGTAGLTALVYGVIRAGNHHWGEQQSTTALVIAAVALTAFAVVQRLVAEPMLPLQLFAAGTRVGAYLIAALLFACLYPCFFLLSRTLQDVQGLSPVAAGLRFLPLGVGVLGFAILARKLLPRTGARPLVVLGTLITAAGAAGLVLFAADPDSSYAAVLLPCIVGLGAGVGTTFVANAALAMTDVPADDAGIGSGLLSTFQAVGGTVGVAVLASIAAASTTDQLVAETGGAIGAATPDVVRDALLAGFQDGFVVAAGLAATAVVIALVVTLTRPKHPTGPTGPAVTPTRPTTHAKER